VQIVRYCTVPERNLRVMEPVKCTGKDHLDEIYRQVLSKGGEGVVLRKAKSLYFDPKVFYKKEPFLDTEALVLGHRTDDAMVCLLPDHSKISVPDRDKKAPPVGAIITIKYSGDEKTVGNPQYYRTRPELVWYEVRRKRWWQESPYRVGYGLPLGLPKCRGCKTLFRERNKPRVMADCLFTPPLSSPYPGQVTFCLNVDCIRKGNVSDSAVIYKDIYQYANWDGRIGVPGEIWGYLSAEMLQLPNVKWEMV